MSQMVEADKVHSIAEQVKSSVEAQVLVSILADFLKTRETGPFVIETARLVGGRLEVKLLYDSSQNNGMPAENINMGDIGVAFFHQGKLHYENSVEHFDIQYKWREGVLSIDISSSLDEQNEANPFNLQDDQIIIQIGRVAQKIGFAGHPGQWELTKEYSKNERQRLMGIIVRNVNLILGIFDKYRTTVALSNLYGPYQLIRDAQAKEVNQDRRMLFTSLSALQMDSEILFAMNNQAARTKKMKDMNIELANRVIYILKKHAGHLAATGKSS